MVKPSITMFTDREKAINTGSEKKIKEYIVIDFYALMN